MPDNFAKPASQLGAQIPNTPQPSAGKGLSLDETGRAAPGLLHQAAATDGQALVWSAANSKWQPGTVSGGGGVSKLYDYTVTGSDKASIDTNVDGTTVANFSGHDVLEVWMYLRTDEVAIFSNVAVTANNDTSSIYDLVETRTNNASVSGQNIRAAANWAMVTAGASSDASTFGVLRITFPNYAGGVGNLFGEGSGGIAAATAANNFERDFTLGYRSTTALSRLAITPVTAAKKFKVGSRLIVYGR